MAVVFWKRKVGGVPVVGIAVVTVVILAVVAWRMAPAPEAVPDESPEEGITEDDLFAESEGPALTGMVTSSGGFVAAPGVSVVTPVTPNTVTVDTNDLWGRRASQWLAAQGKGVLVSQTAIQDYLDGNDLSWQQAELVELATKQFGPPPETVAIGTVAGRVDPARKNGNPPTTHVVKGKNDNTYGLLATLYYGSNTTERRQLIVAANDQTLGTAGPFSVGTRIAIPRYVPPRYFTASKPRYDEANEIGKKNSVSIATIKVLNPGMKFPVKAGTKVRVG